MQTYSPDWVQPWHLAATFSTTLVGTSLLLLALLWSAPPLFVATVGVVLAFQIAVFAYTGRRSHESQFRERQAPESERRETHPTLTVATLMTVARGTAAVVLAGFLVVERPGGLLAWLPALLFGAAALLDGLDGVIARLTETESAFGARLDVEMDSLVMLVGVTVAIRFGQAPIFYLAVGLVRYAFVAALWLRRQQGKEITELPPRFSRRVLGASQLFVVFLVLSPAPGTTESRLLAVVAMIPFLLGFLRDWLLVTGRR